MIVRLLREALARAVLGPWVARRLDLFTLHGAEDGSRLSQSPGVALAAAVLVFAGLAASFLIFRRVARQAWARVWDVFMRRIAWPIAEPIRRDRVMTARVVGIAGGVSNSTSLFWPFISAFLVAEKAGLPNGTTSALTTVGFAGLFLGLVTIGFVAQCWDQRRLVVRLMLAGAAAMATLLFLPLSVPLLWVATFVGGFTALGNVVTVPPMLAGLPGGGRSAVESESEPGEPAQDEDRVTRHRVNAALKRSSYMASGACVLAQVAAADLYGWSGAVVLQVVLLVGCAPLNRLARLDSRQEGQDPSEKPRPVKVWRATVPLLWERSLLAPLCIYLLAGVALGVFNGIVGLLLSGDRTENWAWLPAAAGLLAAVFAEGWAWLAARRVRIAFVATATAILVAFVAVPVAHLTGSLASVIAYLPLALLVQNFFIQAGTTGLSVITPPEFLDDANSGAQYAGLNAPKTMGMFAGAGAAAWLYHAHLTEPRVLAPCLFGAVVAVCLFALCAFVRLKHRAPAEHRPLDPRARPLLVALSVCVAIASVEVIALFASGVSSVALLADLAHNVPEAAGQVALVVAYLLGRQGLEHKAEGFARWALMCGGALGILFSTIELWPGIDLWHAEPAGRLQLIVGAFSFVGNSLVAIHLWRAHQRNGGVVLGLLKWHWVFDAGLGVPTLVGVAGAGLGLAPVDHWAGIVIGAATVFVAYIHRHDHPHQVGSTPLVGRTPPADHQLLRLGIAAALGLPREGADDVGWLLVGARQAVGMRQLEVNNQLPGGAGSNYRSWLVDRVAFGFASGTLAGTTWDLTCLLPAVKWVTWEGNDPQNTRAGSDDGRVMLRCRERPECALILGFAPGRDGWTSVDLSEPVVSLHRALQ